MEWISVKERLPGYETAILVYCPQNENIYCAFYSFDYKWFYFGQGYSEKIEEEVTHWMPLPKPPKESSIDF